MDGSINLEQLFLKVSTPHIGLGSAKGDLRENKTLLSTFTW